MKKYLLLLSALFVSGCVSQPIDNIENQIVREMNLSYQYYNYTWSLEKEDGTVLLKNSGSIKNRQLEKYFVKVDKPTDLAESYIDISISKLEKNNIHLNLHQSYKFQATNFIHIKNEMADLHLPQNTTIGFFNRIAMKNNETAVMKFRSPYANDINKNYIFKITIN